MRREPPVVSRKFLDRLAVRLDPVIFEKSLDTPHPPLLQDLRPHVPIVAVDFDETIATDTDNLADSKLVDGVVEALTRIHDAGYQIVVWTGNSQLADIMAWLDRQGIPYDSVKAKDFLAAFYVDDRALNPTKMRWSDIAAAVISESYNPSPAGEGHKHLIYVGDKPSRQPFADYDTAERLAKERLPEFRRRLESVGLGSVVACIKSRESFEDKVERGKRPEKVGDVLRGAVIVEDDAEIKEVVKRIRKQFDVAKVDVKARPGKYGYYGPTHVDVTLDGMICEVQVMTRKVWQAKMRTEEEYRELRGKEPTKEERAEVKAEFDAATKPAEEKSMIAGNEVEAQRILDQRGKSFNRSAVLANIGYVLGTGRANSYTEDSVFRIFGVTDWAAFKPALHSASEGQLRQALRKIDELQPGLLPAGWEHSAGIKSFGGPGPFELPQTHEAGMVVPKGGSSCASCLHLRMKDDGPHCSSEHWQKWNGGESRLPVDDPETYCSDWWEGKVESGVKAIMDPAPKADGPGFTGQRKEGDRTVCRQNGNIVPCPQQGGHSNAGTTAQPTGAGQANPQTPGQAAGTGQAEPDYSDPKFAADWAAEVAKHMDEIEANDVSNYQFDAQQVAAEQDWHSQYMQWRWGVSANKFNLRPADVGSAARFVSGLLNPALGGLHYVGRLFDQFIPREQAGKIGEDAAADVRRTLDAMSPGNEANEKASQVIAATFGNQAAALIGQMAKGKARLNPEPPKAEFLTNSQLAGMSVEQRRETLKQEQEARTEPDPEQKRRAQAGLTRPARTDRKHSVRERIQLARVKGRRPKPKAPTATFGTKSLVFLEKKLPNCHWVTLENGTHACLTGKGTVVKGPRKLEDHKISTYKLDKGNVEPRRFSAPSDIRAEWDQLNADPTSSNQARNAAYDKMTAQMNEVKTTVRKYMDDHKPKVSEEQQRAVKTYQADDMYLALNKALRSGKDFEPELTKQIDDAIAANTLSEAVIVHRGVSSLKAFGGHPDKLVGKTFRDKAYVSSSLNPLVASEFGEVAIVEISVPKGTNGLMMAPSECCGDENELLLGRNSKFKITEVTKKGKKWHLKAKLIK